MVTQTQIKCPSCGKDTGITEESLRYYSIIEDVHCPHCSSVAVPLQTIMWMKIADRRDTPLNITKPKVKVI